MSAAGNTERLLGRLSAGRTQSAALDETEEVDQGPKVWWLSSHAHTILLTKVK